MSQKQQVKHSTFQSQKHFTHHDEYLELSHDRVSINSKFHFLPENEILPHFLQMASKLSTFFSHKDSTCYDK